MVSIKDVVRSSVKVPRVRQISEEGRRTYWPKRCGNNNKDEDNSPKTLMIKISQLEIHFILNGVRYIITANNPPNTIKSIFIQKNKLEHKNH